MSFILLTSAKHDAPNTRSFNEFKTTDDLAQALIHHFEDYLLTRERIETGRTDSTDDDSVEYKSDELYQFLDEFFSELCCLARQDDDPNLWIPYPKDWVKENCIYLYLRRQHERINKPQRPPLVNGHGNMNPPPGIALLGATSMDIDGMC